MSIRMEFDKLKRAKWLLYAFSFLLPICLMLIVYDLQGIFPFGPYSTLAMDLNEQYVHFYSGFRKALLDSEGLLYSWKLTLGGNFLPIFAYYLGSPLNFLLLFVSEGYLVESIVWLGLLKIGLSAVSMSVLLSSGFVLKSSFTSQAKIYLILPLSTIYSLNSYVLAYGMCLMWMDALILLPLVVLGVHRLHEYRSVWLFYVSLFILCVSNFYIAYMVCIFVCFYAMSLPALHESGWSQMMRSWGRLLLWGLLAIGSAGFLLIPTYMGLNQGRLSYFKTQLDWAIVPSWYEYLNSFLLGYYRSITNSGFPHFFSGLGTLVLAIAYFFHTQRELRKKFFLFFLMMFVLLSFVVQPLDLFWHGFQPPIWFPFRYSFLLSFLICLLAGQMIDKLSADSVPKVFLISLCTIFALSAICFFQRQAGHMRQPIFFTLAFLGCYSAFLFALFLLRKFRFALFTAARIPVGVLISVLLIAESFFNAHAVTERRIQEFPNRRISDYYEFFEPFRKILDKVPSVFVESSNFFRVETHPKYSRNDALSLGLSGLTHYSSLFSRRGLDFFRELGILQRHIWVQHDSSTPFLDSFFGIKFLISDKNPNEPYRKIDEIGNFALYENIHAFPLGFALGEKSDPEIVRNLSGSDPFARQNDLFSYLFPNHPGQLFYPLSELNQIGQSDKMQQFSFSVQNRDPVFLLLPPGADVTGVYLDEKILSRDHDGSVVPLLTLESDPLKNRIHTVSISYGSRSPATSAQMFAMNRFVFESALTSVQNQSLHFQKISTRELQSVRDPIPNRWVITTIPFDSGWKAELLLMNPKTHLRERRVLKSAAGLGYLLSFYVEDFDSSLSGEFDARVRLTYWPPGLTAGLLMTLFSVVLVGVMALVGISRMRVQKKGGLT